MPMGMNPEIYRKCENMESVIFSVFVSAKLDLPSEATTYPL